MFTLLLKFKTTVYLISDLMGMIAAGKKKRLTKLTFYLCTLLVPNKTIATTKKSERM